MGSVRDARFDTLKGFLILSVVFGHFFTHDASHAVASDTIANFIYLFHMPLFVFVSGYFTNNQSFMQRGWWKILETYFIFQLIKGLWSHYSVLWLFIMPGPMLWYLFDLLFWRLLNVGFSKVGLRVSPWLIGIFIALSLVAGFVPWIGREFAFSRFLFFAPYFFLGVYCKQRIIIDDVHKVNPKLCYCVFLVALLASACFAVFHIRIRMILAGTAHYPSNFQLVCFVARLVSYFTSSIISIAFIRLFSFENKLFATIGRDSLKFYMFHGLCLMAIEAVGAPWSTLYSFFYATTVSVAIFFFNKSKLSDFAINPISFIVNRIINRNYLLE